MIPKSKCVPGSFSVAACPPVAPPTLVHRHLPATQPAMAMAALSLSLIAPASLAPANGWRPSPRRFVLFIILP